MIDDRMKKIEVNGRVESGIFPLKGRFKERKIVGIDTETVNADIYSIQLDSEKRASYIDVYGNSEEYSMFLLILHYYARRKQRIVFYAHNLEYDMGVLFPSICREEKKGYIERWGYKIDIFYPNPSYIKFVEQNEDSRTLVFGDTISFYRMSLQKAGNLLNIGDGKLESPEFLGNRKPKQEEIEEFIKYSMRDAYVVRKIAEIGIVKLHKDYGVSLNWTVSPASLSSKIFRKRYLNKRIPYPDCFRNGIISDMIDDNEKSLLILLALKSYYGGRTESFVFGNYDVDVFDYSSHYPNSMTNIKVPIERSWRRVSHFEHEHGFYWIRAEIPEANVLPFPVMDKRLIFPYGKIEGAVTGYEAKQIKKYGEIEDIEGVVYEGESSDCLKNYVHEFYSKKQKAKEDERKRDYQFNKLMLNSLYGKFLQTRKKGIKEYAIVDGEAKEINREYIAGGMFNPVIASWITGYARAKLFKDMRKEDSNVCYCDTDSIMIEKKNNYKFDTGSGLGALEKEGEGNAVFLREKLYLLMRNGEIKKSGLHGFWKEPEKLKELIKEKKKKYTIRKMIKLREAERQGKKPFSENEQKRSIDYEGSNKRESPTINDPLIESERLSPKRYEMY